MQTFISNIENNLTEKRRLFSEDLLTKKENALRSILRSESITIEHLTFQSRTYVAAATPEISSSICLGW